MCSLANGEDALNGLKMLNADGLITCQFDGIKFAHEAKDKPRYAILMVSGYSIEDIENHIPAKVDFLPKPFMPNAIF